MTIKDLLDANLGKWDISKLYTPLPDAVEQSIEDINPTFVTGLVDTWCWKPHISGSYIVRSGYQWVNKVTSIQQDGELTSFLHIRPITKGIIPFNIKCKGKYA